MRPPGPTGGDAPAARRHLDALWDAQDTDGGLVSALRQALDAASGDYRDGALEYSDGSRLRFEGPDSGGRVSATAVADGREVESVTLDLAPPQLAAALAPEAGRD